MLSYSVCVILLYYPNTKYYLDISILEYKAIAIYRLLDQRFLKPHKNTSSQHSSQPEVVKTLASFFSSCRSNLAKVPQAHGGLGRDSLWPTSGTAHSIRSFKFAIGSISFLLGAGVSLYLFRFQWGFRTLKTVLSLA